MRTIVLVVVAVGCFVAGAACAPEQCSSQQPCRKGGWWESCCTDVSCRYVTSDGTVYNCEGKACDAGTPVPAANQLELWCSQH